MKLMCLSPQRMKDQESLLLSSSTGKNHWDLWWNVGRSTANGMVWLVLHILFTCLARREISVSVSFEFYLYLPVRQPVGGGGCTGTPFPVLVCLTHTDDSCTLLLSHAYMSYFAYSCSGYTLFRLSYRTEACPTEPRTL